MRLGAHGISVVLPAGWSGRVFAREPHVATLHAGNFTLAIDDGEFGGYSTSLMHPGGAFLALTEYRPGSGLEPGAGLFASRRLPLPLDPTAFSDRTLAHPRPHQRGLQHFLTASGRPFCLYLVISGDRSHRRRQLAALEHLVRSLKISPRR